MLEAIVGSIIAIGVWCVVQLVGIIGGVINFAIGVVTGDRRGG